MMYDNEQNQLSFDPKGKNEFDQDKNLDVAEANQAAHQMQVNTTHQNMFEMMPPSENDMDGSALAKQNHEDIE